MKIDVTSPHMSINMTQDARDTLGLGIAEIIDTIPANLVLSPKNSKVFSDLAHDVATKNGNTSKDTKEQIRQDIVNHFVFLTSRN